MVEGITVSVVSFFEGVSCEASVGVHRLVMFRHRCLVHNLVRLAVLCFKRAWARVAVATRASTLLVHLLVFFIFQALVVSGN